MIVEIAAGLATTLVFALVCEANYRDDDLDTPPPTPGALFVSTIVTGLIAAALPWLLAGAFALIYWLVT